MKMGWRGRVGFITPPNFSPTPVEFSRIKPPGVDFQQQMLYLERFDRVTSDKIELMLTQLEKAVDLMAKCAVDVIAQAGTPFIFMKGPSFEDETRTRLKKITSTPVIFMAESVVKALKHLGVKKPNVESTYYNDEFNVKYKEYLEFHGFRIPAISGIPKCRNLDAGAELNEFPTSEIYKEAKKLHYDHSDADGLVISGGGIMSLDILDALEKDLGVPVISSNQALYWYALDILNIREPIRGAGSLLESLAIPRKD